MGYDVAQRERWSRVADRVRLLVIVLVACGGTQKPVPDTAPTCAEAAQHLVSLANWDNQVRAPEDLEAGMRAKFAQDCREQQWSPERRSCIATSLSQEATLECPPR